MYNHNKKEEKKSWLQNFCHKLFKKKKYHSKPQNKEHDLNLIKKPKTYSTTKLYTKFPRKTSESAVNSHKPETSYHANLVKQSSQQFHKRRRSRKNIRHKKRNYNNSTHHILYPILRYFLFWCPCFCCCAVKRKKILQNYCENCICKTKLVEQYCPQCSHKKVTSTEKFQNTIHFNKRISNESVASKRSKIKKKPSSLKHKENKKADVHGKDKLKSSSSRLRHPEVTKKNYGCQCLKPSLCVKFLNTSKQKDSSKKGFTFVRKCDSKCKYY